MAWKRTKDLVANIVFADEVPNELLVNSESVDNLVVLVSAAISTITVVTHRLINARMSKEV